MRITGPKRTMSGWLWKGSLAFAAISVASTLAVGQDTILRLDPQHTTVQYDLSDVLHAVHGTFQLKQGTLQLNSASGELSGEIVVDAKSGESGTAMRDRKMHREVLESGRYPEITFRPDHIDGVVAPEGKSSVQVHGIFSIHGADHELTAPAEVEMTSDHWSATVHFSLPYVKWGMKNPSNLFLRVSSSVDIVLTASGSRSVAKP
ncbi:MAG: YceI family protein [Candidatus Sulfotelmatobacter sp.]